MVSYKLQCCTQNWFKNNLHIKKKKINKGFELKILHKVAQLQPSLQTSELQLKHFSNIYIYFVNSMVQNIGAIKMFQNLLKFNKSGCDTFDIVCSQTPEMLQFLFPLLFLQIFLVRIYDRTQFLI